MVNQLTMSHNTEFSKRDPYFDFLRGIAIVFVIGIHTSFHSGSIIELIVDQLIVIAVPLFIALSGYFLVKRDYTYRNKSYWQFLLRKIPKLYLSMIFWSLPFFVNSLICGDKLLPDIIWLLTGSYSIMYFIPLIIQIYLLLPIFKERKISTIVMYTIISVVLSVIVIVISLLKSENLPFLYTNTPCLFSLCFFALGCYIGKNGLPNISKSLVLSLSVVFLFALIEHKILNDKYGYFSSVRPMNKIYCLIAIIMLFSKQLHNWFKLNFFTKLIIYLGSLSLGIYLTHMLILISLNFVFGSTWQLVWTTSWAIVLCLDVLAIVLLKNILPQKLDVWIGMS